MTSSGYQRYRTGSQLGAALLNFVLNLVSNPILWMARSGMGQPGNGWFIVFCQFSAAATLHPPADARTQ